MPCAFCNATIPAGSKFCPQCGADAAQSPHADPYFDPYRAPTAAPVPYASPAGRTSGYAAASIVCGAGAWFFIPVLLAIPAIVCGHLARREIRESGGRVDGDWMAMLGLILGYAQVALGVVILLIVAVVLIVAVAANA